LAQHRQHATDFNATAGPTLLQQLCIRHETKLVTPVKVFKLMRGFLTQNISASYFRPQEEKKHLKRLKKNDVKDEKGNKSRKAASTSARNLILSA
jgi:hypothetical protein